MRSILLLLALSLPAFAQSATARNANYWRSCTATVTTNCNPRTDANGNLPMGAVLPGASSGGTVGTWNKYTVAYTNAAFKAAATAVSITLGELPAEGVVEAVRIKHSQAFAGTGVTSTTCSLGDGTDHTAYADAFNVFQAVSNTAQYWDGGAYSSTAAAHNLTLRCTANTNFGSGSATVLTAGSVTVWIKTAVLQ